MVCHYLSFNWISLCSILVSAFVGCALAFGCFSAAAMLARRREFLYLGGLLSSGLSILFWLHFASSIFGGSMALFKFEVLKYVVNLVRQKLSKTWTNMRAFNLLHPFSLAVVFWTLGVCGLHSSWYPGYHWEGALWRSRLCETRSYLIHWFCRCVCPNSHHHGEKIFFLKIGTIWQLYFIFSFLFSFAYCEFWQFIAVEECIWEGREEEEEEKLSWALLWL